MTARENRVARRMLLTIATALAAGSLLGTGCQRQAKDQPGTTAMDLDTSYASDSSVMVVQRGESVVVGETHEQPDQMMGADSDGKGQPSKDVTWVEKGDSLRLEEVPSRR